MYRSFTNTLVLTYLQLIIEAQRGNGYKGDMAIDDISITDSNCPSKKHALFLVHHNKPLSNDLHLLSKDRKKFINAENMLLCNHILVSPYT